jgi:tetratricopeptide (TPR) repeat protein
MSVPVTIQQMIERQIEQCSEEEQIVLEAGSVEGVEFSTATMGAVLDQESSQIEDICQRMVRRHKLLCSPGALQLPNGRLATVYRFAHALYRDACYQRVLERRRIQLHRLIGAYMEVNSGSKMGETAAELAMHFDQGREYCRAVKYYLDAADDANRRYAGQEALKLARRGLQLLNSNVNMPERLNREVELQIELGVALMATRGFSIEEVKEVFARARELCIQLDDIKDLFPALFGLWQYCYSHSEYEAARQIAKQLLWLGQGQDDPLLLSEAHYAMGISLIAKGDFLIALDHFEKGIKSRGDQICDNLPLIYRADPGLVCRCNAALTRYCLGFPHQALKTATSAVALAQESFNSVNRIYAHSAAALVYRWQRESKEALKQLEAGIALARQHGWVQLATDAASIYGWALASLGHIDKAIEQIHRSLATQREMGATHLLTEGLAILARVLLDAGRLEQGSTAIVEAQELARSSGFATMDSEIYQLKGDLLVRKAERENLRPVGRRTLLEEAETCFHHSIDVAQMQHIKTFELRAAISLAQLLKKQNRIGEALRFLTPIYGWFTEGHNTPDLQTAHQLLQELSNRN